MMYLSEEKNRDLSMPFDCDEDKKATHSSPKFTHSKALRQLNVDFKPSPLANKTS
jgi:hypothetical protein